ncbi:MAG TPA: DNA internalization-related competence protein ComEC/Rec2 [Terriglobales bacterium]|nr:DNA internalization-related competence protein ComEC/Rec2 [Terriglobales bacterium]
MSAKPPQTQPAGRPCRQPLLYAALAFGAGIVIGVHAWRPATWWLAAFSTFALAGCVYLRRDRRVVPWISFALWFWLGALSIQLRPNPEIPDIASFLGRDKEVLVTAHVIHEGYMREGAFGGQRQTIDVRTEELRTPDSTSTQSFGLRIAIYAKQSGDEDEAAETANSFRLFRYGERLRLVARLREPHNYGNPGAFDYRSYLADQGIVALGSAKAESVEVLPRFYGNPIESWRSRIHRRVIEKVHALWPPEQAGLLDAAVIGEDAFIQRDTRVDFQRSGTYHILVVSGMNVSILAFVAFWTLRRFRASELLASLITVLLGVGYAFLTDVGPPVWRATLMMACYLGARLLYRNRSILNALGGAALGLMIADPKSLLGASFQLTFLSVLLLAGLAIPILERSSQPYRRGLRHMESIDYDRALEPAIAQFRLDVRMIAKRLARFLGARVAQRGSCLLCAGAFAAYDILFVSALMQIGLALPMAWYFHRATIVGLPANVLAIPLTEILMPAAVLALGLGFISASLAKIPALIAGLALDGITTSVRALGALRIADVRVAMPELQVAAAGAIAIAFGLLLARRNRWWAFLGVGSLIAAALWTAFIPPHFRYSSAAAEITALDVGQGDSTLVVSPEGRTMLIDAGGMAGAARSNFDIGEDVVSPYLWSRGITRLDVIVVTHGHWDHVGGMKAVMDNFRPREIWVGNNAPTPALRFLLQHARERHVDIRLLEAGDSLQLGALDFRALAPAKDLAFKPRRANDDCLALKVTYRSTSVLLEGDAEKTTERQIAEEAPQAELLKVGHHGSATSTSADLLDAVSPRLALISVGRDNSYGHPRQIVLQRLERAGVKVYRTDLNGLVTFYMNEHGITPAAALR